MTVIRFILIAFVALYSWECFALSSNEKCDSVSANTTITGTPHHFQKSTKYGTSGCTNGYRVNYNYQSPEPATFLSWASDPPSDSGKCARAKLRVYAWNISSKKSVYMGSKNVKGKWQTNPDPARIKGSKICNMPSIRLEKYFHFSNGQKYRLAIRAEQAWQAGGYSKRKFVLASAPIANYSRSSRAYASEWYVAIPKIDQVKNAGRYDKEAVDGFRFNLKKGSRVDLGGDLLFANGEFIIPRKTYRNRATSNFGHSNAALIPKGSRTRLNFSCPAFEITEHVNAVPSYTYLDGNYFVPSTSHNSAYCVLNEDNSSIYSMRVHQSSADLLIVAYQWKARTEHWAMGCFDGFCSPKVEVVTTFTKQTLFERDSYVAKAFQLLGKSRLCLEDHLGRVLKVPLTMDLHGEGIRPSPGNGTTFGLGGSVVTVVGFQGIRRAGSIRATSPDDLRFELHESMHVFNYHFFKDQLPSWLNEGLAIQTTRLNCGNDPDYMRDSWRHWSPGSTSGHAIGSEFFRRLDQDYGCDAVCTAGAWRRLVDRHANDASLTNREIKTVFEDYLGVNLDTLFNTLAIND